MRAGEFDRTPLHEAAATGTLRTARMLIERGADVPTQGTGADNHQSI